MTPEQEEARRAENEACAAVVVRFRLELEAGGAPGVALKLCDTLIEGILLRRRAFERDQDRT